MAIFQLDLCGPLGPFIDVERCTPTGLFTAFTLGIAALVAGAIWKVLKDAITNQPLKALWLFFSLAGTYVLTTASPVLRTLPAVAAAALPLAALTVGFSWLSKWKVSKPITVRLDKLVVASVPLFLLVGGGIGWIAGAVQEPKPLVYLVPAEPEPAGAKEAADASEHVYIDMRKHLVDLWHGTQILDVYPDSPSALIDFEKFAGPFRAAGSSEWDKVFAKKSTPIPVRFPITANVRVVGAGIVVRPSPFAYLPENRIYAADNSWTLGAIAVHLDSADVAAIAADYYLSKELLRRACPRSTEEPKPGCEANAVSAMEKKIAQNSSRAITDAVANRQLRVPNSTVSCADYSCADALMAQVQIAVHKTLDNSNDKNRGKTQLTVLGELGSTGTE